MADNLDYHSGRSGYLLAVASQLGTRYVLEAWDEGLPTDDLNEKRRLLGFHTIARDPKPEGDIVEGSSVLQTEPGDIGCHDPQGEHRYGHVAPARMHTRGGHAAGKPEDL